MKHFKRQLFVASCIVAGGLTAQAAPTTAPSATPATNSPSAQLSAPSDVEVRGLEEFNRAQYAIALPMLQKAAAQLSGQPDRLSTIQEDIRVCQRNIAIANGAVPGGNGSPVQLASLTPVAIPVVATPTTEPSANGMVPGGLGGTMRLPHAKPAPNAVQEMAIKDLGNFDYDAEKGGNVPADVLALDGSKIRLSGFMIPMDQAESITKFALVPSLFSCCYGQPPQLQHTIIVTVPKGKAVNYFPDEISVEGTLHVREKKEDGFIVSLFDVDTTSVKPAPK